MTRQHYFQRKPTNHWVWIRYIFPTHAYDGTPKAWDMVKLMFRY